jgi:hypothetical protein
MFTDTSNTVISHANPPTKQADQSAKPTFGRDATQCRTLTTGNVHGAFSSTKLAH